MALIHAQYVGEEGTVRVKGLTFADLEQARSADHVIVVCEEIVSRSAIREDPDQNSLPAFLVDAVVKAPFGALIPQLVTPFTITIRAISSFTETWPRR